MRIKWCEKCNSIMFEMYAGLGGWEWHCVKCQNKVPLEQDEVPSVSQDIASKGYTGLSLYRGKEFTEARKAFQEIVRSEKDAWLYIWYELLCICGVTYCSNELAPVIWVKPTKQNLLKTTEEFRMLISKAASYDSDVSAFFNIQADLINHIQHQIILLEAKKNTDVFVSYSSHNPESRAFAKCLKDRFIEVSKKTRNYQAEVFYAEESLNGQNANMFESHVFHALYTAKELVLVIGKETLAANRRYPAISEWMLNEYERFTYFHGIEKVRICLVNEATINDIPINMRNIQMQQLYGTMVEDRAVSAAQSLALSFLCDLPKPVDNNPSKDEEFSNSQEDSKKHDEMESSAGKTKNTIKPKKISMRIILACIFVSLLAGLCVLLYPFFIKSPATNTVTDLEDNKVNVAEANSTGTVVQAEMNETTNALDDEIIDYHSDKENAKSQLEVLNKNEEKNTFQIEMPTIELAEKDVSIAEIDVDAIEKKTNETGIVVDNTDQENATNNKTENTTINDSNTLPIMDTDISMGDQIAFGQYPQRDSDPNRRDPIQWTVIGKNEYAVQLLCNDCLDAVPFSLTNEIAWSKSYLREWLNDEFTQSFTQAEKDRILRTDLNEGGLILSDKVFVLSYKEIEEYHVDLMCLGTDYARSRNLPLDESGHSIAWDISGKLRIPETGAIESKAGMSGAVRPCIWVDFTSDYQLHKRSIYSEYEILNNYMDLSDDGLCEHHYVEEARTEKCDCYYITYRCDKCNNQYTVTLLKGMDHRTGHKLPSYPSETADIDGLLMGLYVCEICGDGFWLEQEQNTENTTIVGQVYGD